MYWRSSQDRDSSEFYNDKFMGFGQTTVSKPDGSVEIHKLYGTEGVGVYDTNQVACTRGSPAPVGGHCGTVPWQDLTNAAHMHEYELDRYDTNGFTLLSQVKTTWQALCPPSGVGGSPAKPGYGSQWGMLVSELDQGTNAVVACDVRKLQTDTYTYDVPPGGAGVHSATSYSYDSYGRVVHQTQLANADAADESGNADPAALMGEVTQPVPGLVPGNGDTATAFDGSTGYVQLPSAAFGSYPTSGSTTSYALTFEAWFKTSSGGVILGQVSGNMQPSTPTYAGGWIPALYVDTTGALQERLFWHNGPPLNVAAGPYNDAQPHHVVVTYTNGVDSLYVDGQLKASQSSDSEVAYSPTYNYYVGDGFVSTYPNTPTSGNGWWPFTGTIGEVAVYGSALSAARVQAHFAAGSGYHAAVAADSPTAYWRLNEQAGTTSPNAIVGNPAYIQNDAVAPTSNSATGHYLIDKPAFSDTEDTSANRYQCSFSQYDGMTSWVSGQQPGLTVGNLTKSTRNTGCGTAANNYSDVTGPIMTTSVYDAYGNRVGSTDPDANAGNSAHVGCTVGSTSYSACTAYDGIFGVLPKSASNALNQSSSTAYQTPYQPPTTIVDGSGHGNTATPNGSLSFGSPGLVAGNGDASTGFDGSTAWVQVPSSVFGSYPTSGSTTAYALTFEAWFKTTSGGAILGQTGGTGWIPAVFVDTAGAVEERLFWHNGPPLNVAAGPYNDGHPHHVVATYANGVDSLYVDGQLKASQSGDSEVGYASSYSYQLGTADVSTYPNTPPGAVWWPFTGTIGEAAVYGTALSASRVLAHFNGGSGYQAAVAADSPTAYWRLNDGSPNTAPTAGFGLWPTSQTDANGQTTSIAYDALGREAGRTLPGETGGLTTVATTYTVWCSGTAAQTPCVEVDKTQRLNGTTTATSRAFYDGLGHLVETRSPAPGGQDIVNYSFYNPSQPQLFKSLPYLVSAYTGGPGAAAYSIPDSTVAGTTSTYDGLGRLLTSTDALSFRTGKSYSVVCSPAGTGDPGCYEQTLSVDANGHQGGSLVDGLGRTAYMQRYTGNSSPTYSLYATAKYAYDFVGNLVKIVQPDGVMQTTFGYDMAGRKTAMTDPDLGSQTYAYDQNGNLTQSIDARNGAGTTFVGYDGLDRTIWRNTSNSPTGAYDTYTYDATANGNAGVGRMTSETFAAGALGGSYAYTYDGRGQQTANTLTVNGAGLPPPPAFVQQASGHAANVPSLGATFAANVTNGDRIVVVVGVWNSGATASGVADSAGNTYTKVAGRVASDGTEETIWTAPITAGGGTKPTVTATATGTADIGIAVSEYSGLSTAAGSAAVDQSVITFGTSSGAATASSGATPATTAGNELAVGAYVDSGFNDTLSYGSGWSGRVNVSPASDMELAVEDQVVGQGATPNAQVSTSASSTWLMATVVFKGATTGGANVVSTTRSSYDDAGNVLTRTYPDGQTITDSYTAEGWLSGVATSQGNTTLASNLAYGAGGGAFGEITGMHLGGGYDYSASYDLLDRATDLKTTKTSGGTVMFDQSRTFGATGNVTTTSTTMPGATDNQSFCYDEQDRLTWASSATATPPCGGSNTAGTLTAAQYTQSFSYDVLGRLTSGPLGSYIYGSSAHVHAATGIGTAWTAVYDAAGNMTCRAPSGSTTCAGTPTGAQLGYNNEGELQSWQNAPSSPSTTAQFLYDGQGQRVEQSVTQASATTTTVYVGNLAEMSTSAGTTTTTAYYYAAGKRIGLSVNGVVSYLASDGLGSATVTLSSSGTATASQLFAPYGGVRYSGGTMSTSFGFTGQRADAVSGLDYYGARYYDPLAGQFTSGDSVMPGGGFDIWGLSRYTSVEGNPENRTDPTGHINLMIGGDDAPAPIENAFSGTYSWGGGPVTYHRPWTAPYRPRPTPRRPTYRPRGGDPERGASAKSSRSVTAAPTPTLPARLAGGLFHAEAYAALEPLSIGIYAFYYFPYHVNHDFGDTVPGPIRSVDDRLQVEGLQWDAGFDEFKNRVLHNGEHANDEGLRAPYLGNNAAGRAEVWLSQHPGVFQGIVPPIWNTTPIPNMLGGLPATETFPGIHYDNGQVTDYAS
jgi:RHS repeat-associated protein